MVVIVREIRLHYQSSGKSLLLNLHLIAVEHIMMLLLAFICSIEIVDI